MSGQLCPDCGRPLPAAAPAGLCPNCLLKLGARVEPTGNASGALATSEATAAVSERPGHRIGRYKLLEPIGEGGFGTVWLAEQQEPVRRKVALKIIKLGMDTKEVVARFEAERQALALMDHPNIARVFDGGATEGGRPYFVMELVKGQRITDYCDARQLSTEARLKLFIEVCQAVQHAHQKGVIHRDLKPSNVLVTEQDGRAVPKVIDFGIAKATEPELTGKTFFTRFNQLIGTPAYMSPEQAGFGSLDVDTRSDIYSLGVLLYELLTGRTPFSSEELLKAGLDQVLRTIREKEPPKPSTQLSTLTQADLQLIAKRRAAEPAKLNRMVRGELDWIVMKCLEKDRARRYETANGLARDLERHLNCEPVVAAAPTLTYRFAKFASRHRVGLATSIAFVLLLFAGVLVSTWQAIRATRLAASEAQHRRNAEFNHYVADVRAVQLALGEGNLREARACLARQEPRPGNPDLRSVDWWLLAEQAHGEESRTFSLAASNDAAGTIGAPPAGPVRGLAISKNGRWLAATENRGVMKVWRLEDAALLHQWQNREVEGGRCQLLEFSPDSRWLVSACTSGVRLISTENWGEARVQPADGEHARFMPDGQRFGVARDGHLTLFGSLQREATDVPDVDLEASLQFEFCASGHEVVVFGSNGLPQVHDLLTKSNRPLRGGQTALTTLAISDDGKWLAAGGWTGEVTIWNLATGEVQRSWKAHAGLSFGLVFSHDSKLLASGGSDQTLRLWNVETGSPVRAIKGNLDEIWRIRFSPDDRRVYTACKDGVVREFQTQKPQAAPEIPEIRWEFARVRLSTNNQTAALVYREAGDWEIRDAATLAVRQSFQLPFNQADRSGWLVTDNTGTWLAAGTKAGEIVVMSAASGQIVRRHQLATTSLEVIAISPDALRGVTFARDPAPQATFKLWNLATGVREETFAADADDAFGVAFSHDGHFLTVPAANSDTVALWSVPEHRIKHRLEGHRARLSAVAFSGDDQLLATCGNDGEVRLWQVGTGRMLNSPLLGHYSGVTEAYFVNQGRTLLTTGADMRILAWDVPTGQLTTWLPGYLLYANEKTLAKVVMEHFRMPTPGDRAKGEVIRFGQGVAGRQE